MRTITRTVDFESLDKAIEELTKLRDQGELEIEKAKIEIGKLTIEADSLDEAIDVLTKLRTDPEPSDSRPYPRPDFPIMRPFGSVSVSVTVGPVTVTITVAW